MRRFIDRLWPQMCAHARWVSFVYAPGIALLIVVAFADAHTRFPASYFLRDAADTVGEPFFLGAISSLGAVLWFAAGSVCLFAAGLLRRADHCAEPRSFLVAAGVFTVLMALDDLFQIHEEIVPDLIFRNVKVFGQFEAEVFVLGFYMLVLVVILVRWNELIRTTDYLYLMVSLAFFVVGAAADRGIIGGSAVRDKEVRVLIEDGSKFLGITGWLHYFARTAHQQVLVALRSPASADVAG